MGFKCASHFPSTDAPFGSERSHFAHSPHLLAALIPLIPPEIGGASNGPARGRGRAGLCALRRGGRQGTRGEAGAGGAPLSVGAGGSPSPGPGRPGRAAVCAGRPGALGAGAGWGEARRPDAPTRARGPGGARSRGAGGLPRVAPALTRCSSPAHFPARDLPSVNSSLT